MSFHRRSGAVITVACLIAAGITSIPGPLLAQGGVIDPARVPLPLEALQSKGQQSAVRILSYTRIPLGETDRRDRSGSATLEVLNIGTGVRFGVSNRVLTARSVIMGADSIVVEVGWRRMPATLLGSDEATHLALLSVNDLMSSNDPPGPSEMMPATGDITLMVDPLQDRTIIHQGEIRSVLSTGLILTTMPIYPGLSGAPLLDSRGELVGVVILSWVQDMADTGPGNAAAVTVDIAAHVAAEIEEFGQVRWGWIGGSADPAFNESVILQAVSKGSPTDLAGLRPGDHLTHYGEQELITPQQLRDLVLATVPGTAVPVRAMRDSQNISVQLIVGDWSEFMTQQPGALIEPAPTPDMVIVARFHAIFNELNRLFSAPGFDPERSDVRSRILTLERAMDDLRLVSLPDRPPPARLPH